MSTRAARDEAESREIDALIDDLRRRARRLYRFALGLRVVIAVCSFIAVLPDSSLFHLGGEGLYGGVTTAAGVVAALLVLIATNSRVAETIKARNELISYLQKQSLVLLTADGLTRRRIRVEIQQEIAANEARLQRGVLEGLDRMVAPKEPSGPPG